MSLYIAPHSVIPSALTPIKVPLTLYSQHNRFLIHLRTYLLPAGACSAPTPDLTLLNCSPDQGLSSDYQVKFNPIFASEVSMTRPQRPLQTFLLPFICTPADLGLSCWNLHSLVWMFPKATSFHESFPQPPVLPYRSPPSNRYVIIFLEFWLRIVTLLEQNTRFSRMV